MPPYHSAMGDNGEMLAMAIVALRKAHAHAKVLESEAKELRAEVGSALACLPTGAAASAQTAPSQDMAVQCGGNRRTSEHSYAAR